MSIFLYSGLTGLLSFALGLVFCKRMSRGFEAQPEAPPKLEPVTVPERAAPACSSFDTVFRQITESLGQIFWIADCEQKRLVYVSPSMFDTWLIDPRAVLNDASYWFASVHPADRERAEKAYFSMLDGDISSCEYRMVRADGEIRWVRSRNQVLHASPDGGSKRVAGLLEDVTSERKAHNALQDSRDELVKHVNELKGENRERRRAEEQLRAAKDLAEAGSRAKSQFLRNVSHELRTPLNGIMGMVQLALESELSKDQRDFLNVASESATKLLAIVNDILDFTQTDTGRLELAEAPFNLRDAIREVANRVAPQAAEKQLDFAWFLSSHVPTSVVGDKRRLMQVVTHLCANAVKFTQQGSVTLEVSCEDRADRRRVSFTVSDTGIGIPEECRSTIFEAFTQADGSLTRSQGGTGIGLAICSRLVALMSGDIGVQSEPGKGSRFTFSIPMGMSRTSLQVPSQSARKDHSVLIVDANAVTREFSSRLLAEEQLEGLTAASGRAAIDALESNRENMVAVLIAAELGDGEDGIVLAKTIADRFGYRQKLLIHLGRTHEAASQITRCRELGFLNTFNWPLDYDEVRQRVRSLLAGPSPHNGGGGIIAAKSPVCQSLRVLLVEDNPINQTVLKRMLQKQGHSVVTADNGLEALTRLDEMSWAVDLVLMDVQMPEMDGYQATAKIRAMEQTRGGHLAIIAATAHAMTGDAERCLAAGMDGYISKPIQPDALPKAIMSALGRAQIDGELRQKVS